MDYKIIYSNRKTYAISVKDAQVVVRAPYSSNPDYIRSLVNKNAGWIEKQIKRQLNRYDKELEIEGCDIKRVKTEARQYFEAKVDEFAEIMNLKYGRITITSAKTRFGSCNSKGNICFSYRLMFYPEKAREYVVVHELAHIVHLNHSKQFYDLVARYMPDYKERKKLLV